jgi:hypothetical protein
VAEQEHDRLADALERDADKLATHGEEVEEQIEGARAEWERKRRDPNVPGANPPAREDEAPPPRYESDSTGKGGPAGVG